MKKHFYFFTISGLLGVILGAFSAHYLKELVKNSLLDNENLESFKTGILYQLLHTLLLGYVLILNAENRYKLLYYATIFLEAGILLFSGSIYLLTINKIWVGDSNLFFLALATPIGGMLFVFSWFMLFLHFRNKFGRTIEK